MRSAVIVCVLVWIGHCLFAGGIYTNLDEAKGEAEYYDQPILMVFSGSDWCKPCIRLQEQVFNDPKFEAFAEANLVMCHIDMPRNKDDQSEEQQKHNTAMAEQYNADGAFPKLLLLNTSGEVIASIDHSKADTETIIELIEAQLK